ncbi:NAD(P)/FAD-dependent oxidoreductase [Mycobacterium sp.]|jgi:phytoene dehydrogenase-like protein|uniref:phytoene desaturase family protein n=1 Tax=Mycobacterium sp. TaxID=1785 RepID=UPI002D323198|nr:NAD(P)/FAD-dependent oxidoreductase [Mycobacterium sp.]HZA09797.1 NAD(P)/FAD-dependent oxidoreductase [Mycobacterium sp.]
MSTAIIVGSGPNGLAAAITLAENGVEVTVLEAKPTIGGGTRTSELTLPGLLHDDCSAVHPMTAASPFIQSQRLENYGLRWRYPEIDMAHPFDDGNAATLHTSIDATANQFPDHDARAWRKVFAPLAQRFDRLRDDVFRPIVHFPEHPFALAGLGIQSMLPATVLARRWRTAQARALFGGVAAHIYYPLSRPATSAVGLMITAAGHRYGWPVAEGGSRSVSDAMAKRLAELEANIETGVTVESLSDLAADVVMLDLAPRAVAGIAGDKLPARVRRAYRRYRHGPGAYKLDIALDGDIPWRNPACRRAGTVHVGGTFEEIVAAERDIANGVMPRRPFVLVGQQYLADPTRSSAGRNPVWAYAHVPHGYTGDATEATLAQIERFAPGFKERVLAVHVRTPADLAAYNPNYIGGDILTGRNDPLQVLLRPRVSTDPYRTAIPGTYICSAATPPGTGVHGMCGHNAALSALRYLQRI